MIVREARGSCGQTDTGATARAITDLALDLGFRDPS
jgi:hypothetical protein